MVRSGEKMVGQGTRVRGWPAPPVTHRVEEANERFEFGRDDRRGKEVNRQVCP